MRSRRKRFRKKFVKSFTSWVVNATTSYVNDDYRQFVPSKEWHTEHMYDWRDNEDVRVFLNRAENFLISYAKHLSVEVDKKP